MLKSPWPMLPNLVGKIALLAFAQLFMGISPLAQAAEFFPYSGLVDRTPISGCCRKPQVDPGVGMLARIEQVGQLGALEVVGYSDLKWSEASVGKYFYLIGRGPAKDPASTKEMSIMRFSMWVLVASIGVGFFTHNTKTIDYNLPTVVTGGQGVARLHLTHTLTDRWSLGALISLGVGLSSVDMIFTNAYGLGVAYRY